MRWRRLLLAVAVLLGGQACDRSSTEEDALAGDTSRGERWAAPLFGLVFREGPGNPVLSGVPEGTGWDERHLESPMVIRGADGRYYMYYHASSRAAPGYRIGLATAPSPEGPWSRYGDAPVLVEGPPGSWDEGGVGIGHVERVGSAYWMWYEGYRPGADGPGVWQIGLATAGSPWGPWVKYEGNPILEVGEPGSWDARSLYVGSVARVGDAYYLWYVGFAQETDGDGRLGLATAASPQGPWTRHAANPVISPGLSGSWSAGQIGEAAIIYRGGRFHALYAGYPERRIRGGKIGYAYSSDGVRWEYDPANPVVAGRPGAWNAHQTSEPHLLVDGGKLYLFVTGAYYPDDGGGPVETLGMLWAELPEPER